MPIERSAGTMDENEKLRMTPISKARSLEEIGDFWDSHSLADYWDQTHEVEIEVRARRRRRVTVDPDIYARIQERARERGILPETLINVWLLEQLETAR
jgi:hypothetical protein